MRSCDFPVALRLVAGLLGLDPKTPIDRAALDRARRQWLTTRFVTIDRRALAFRFELAALDRRLRADNIFEAAKGIDVSSLTAVELDRALRHVGQAYSDRERAELFEGLTDTLRERDFAERSSRGNTRAA